MASPYMRRRHPWKVLLCALAVVLALSWLSSLIVSAHMPWYEGLEKAGFNPPSWVFGVVWPALYVLMTVAAWLVWSHPVRHRKSLYRARWLFIVQLLLNLTWTPVFFGLENPAYGMAWLVLVWLAVVATMWSFWGIRRVAVLLFVPYFLWVSFAAVLNYQILVLN